MVEVEATVVKEAEATTVAVAAMASRAVVSFSRLEDMLCDCASSGSQLI